MSLVEFKQGRGRPRVIKVPTSFEVLGHTVKVLIVPESVIQQKFKEEGYDLDEREGYEGLYTHRNHTIYLNEKLQGSELVQTFLHEKQHCLLYSAGYDELSEDETLVDLLAELEYQSQKSAKGRVN